MEKFKRLHIFLTLKDELLCSKLVPIFGESGTNYGIDDVETIVQKQERNVKAVK